MRKTLQIASVALILFTSTGMTVGFHYCGKLLQEVALFGKTKPCCGRMEMPAGCCHDEKLVIKSDDCSTAQFISNLGFVPVLISEIDFPILDFSLQFQNAHSNFLTYLDKDRPPMDWDIVVRIQSFLIWFHSSSWFQLIMSAWNFIVIGFLWLMTFHLRLLLWFKI